MTKVTIEMEDGCCTVSDYVVTADEVLELCRRAMMGAGFCESSVNEAILAAGEQAEMEASRAKDA